MSISLKHLTLISFNQTRTTLLTHTCELWHVFMALKSLHLLLFVTCTWLNLLPVDLCFVTTSLSLIYRQKLKLATALTATVTAATVTVSLLLLSLLLQPPPTPPLSDQQRFMLIQQCLFASKLPRASSATRWLSCQWLVSCFTSYLKGEQNKKRVLERGLKEVKMSFIENFL